MQLDLEDHDAIDAVLYQQWIEHIDIKVKGQVRPFLPFFRVLGLMLFFVFEVTLIFLLVTIFICAKYLPTLSISNFLSKNVNVVGDL